MILILMWNNNIINDNVKWNINEILISNDININNEILIMK